MNFIAIYFVRFYQKFISPVLPGSCRFYPSCSQYAIECFKVFPFHRAFLKSAWRILRCNPLSKGYFDPVIPEKEQAENMGQRDQRDS